MIIGKSLTALGGGGLKPEIRVTAKTGALLNLHFKDSSIILQSYQLGAEETQHTFVVSVSETAYVVEDVTNGKSVEVLVDAIAVFKAEIQYALWLYRDGNECEDVTGGWGGKKVYYANSYFTPTVPEIIKTSDNMFMRLANDSYKSGVVIPNNWIDLTPYNTLYFETSSEKQQPGINCGGGCWKSLDKYQGRGVVINSSTEAYDHHVTTYDISEFSGTYMVGVLVSSGGEGGTPFYSSVTVHKVWLE